LRYCEIHFDAELSGDMSRAALPPFLGTTLRGAFGFVLKKLVCQVAHGQCGRCLLRSVCPYSTIFEGMGPPERRIMRKYPRVPQPFVLVVPGPRETASEAEDDRLRWGVRLFGPAMTYWPYVVHAFETAGEEGVGRNRVRFRLERVTDAIAGEPLVTGAEETGAEPSALRIPEQADGEMPEGPCTLRWRFETPLRIRHGRRLNPAELDPFALVLAGRRRHDLMQHFYGEGDADGGRENPWLDAERFETVASDIRPWGFERYSRRQRRRMRLDGLLGEATIRGPWHEVGAWLMAADRLHLGKATSFGFGRVRWEYA
jgi:hypothetical protein